MPYQVGDNVVFRLLLVLNRFGSQVKVSDLGKGLQAGLIEKDNIIINANSGVSGAGTYSFKEFSACI